jgi:hypothetical protein
MGKKHGNKPRKVRRVLERSIFSFIKQAKKGNRLLDTQVIERAINYPMRSSVLTLRALAMA